MKLEKASKGAEVSEALVAQDFCRRIALPAQSRGADDKGQISYVFGVLSKRNRPEKQWTWRRVKTLWYGDLPDRAVRAWELRQLEETAALLATARKAHADYIAETERLAAMLLHQDEDFHGPQVAALRNVARGVDLPGTDSRAGGARR
jgi:hypothetical protein